MDADDAESHLLAPCRLF